MVLLFVLGIAMVVLAIVLVGSAFSSSAETGVTRSLAVLEAMTNSPKELTKDLDKSFGERVLDPLQGRALVIGRRISGADTSERIRRKLDLAGNPPGWTVDRVVSGKVLGAVAGLILGLVFQLMLDAPMVRIIVVIGLLVAGFFAPNLYLYQKAHDRAEQLTKSLPDAIDLLTISVESGLGFDAAVQQVARNTTGPLSEEFSRVLREMQIGSGRADALRGMGERTSNADVRSFVGAMVQADSFGIPVAQVLRIQSSELRVKRRQRAEEKAQQVPVKITIPLIFCILPTLFIAVMGPAVISIMDSFSKK
jgi:tight adherence protein C